MHQPHRAAAAADGHFVAVLQFAHDLAVGVQDKRWPRVVTALTLMVADSGRMMERLDRACGQMGVSANTSAVGSTIAPPAASEYAVEPVGELTIKPSQR